MRFLIKNIITITVVAFMFIAVMPVTTFAMQIFVKLNVDDGVKHITLEVEPTDRIEDVKTKIFDKNQIPVENQQLSIAGKKLEEGNTLQYYSIQKDSTLHLIVIETDVKYIPPVAKEKLVYEGKPIEIITPGSSENGTMQYALGDSDTVAPMSGWSIDVPEINNAGTFFVWYKVDGDNYVKDLEPRCIRVGVDQQNGSLDYNQETSKNLDQTPETGDHMNPWICIMLLLVIGVPTLHSSATIKRSRQ